MKPLPSSITRKHRIAQKQNYRVIYPPYNLYSDHPMCLIDHKSITTAQHDAGLRFQQFLLSHDIQLLATKYGFRPADTSVPTFGPDSAFTDTLQAAGIGKGDFQQLQIPDGDTIFNLLAVWKRNTNFGQ